MRPQAWSLTLDLEAGAGNRTVRVQMCWSVLALITPPHWEPNRAASNLSILKVTRAVPRATSETVALPRRPARSP